MSEENALDGLEFTPAAKAKAEDYGHTAEMYADLPPGGANGEYLVDQVESLERPAPEPEVAAEPEDLEPGDTVEVYGFEVEVGTWKTMNNYICPECPYATPTFSAIEAHIEVMHFSAPKPEPSRIILTDRFGNAINEE